MRTEVAVVAPAGETPETFAKREIARDARVWRAEAKAYFRGWMAFLGWTCAAMLAAQVWGPAIAEWVRAHSLSGYSMSLVGAAAVLAVFVYRVVEVLRNLRETGRALRIKAVR